MSLEIFFFFFVRITLREFHNQRRKTSFFSGLSDRSSKQMERGSERGAMEGETEELKNHSLASLKHIIKVKRGAERERGRASLQSRREVTEKPQSTQRAANTEEEIRRKSVSKYFFMPVFDFRFRHLKARAQKWSQETTELLTVEYNRLSGAVRDQVTERGRGELAGKNN